VRIHQCGSPCSRTGYCLNSVVRGDSSVGASGDRYLVVDGTLNDTCNGNGATRHAGFAGQVLLRQVPEVLHAHHPDASLSA
jgi:hypothetical protein